MKALIITSSDVFPIFLFLIFFSIIFLFFSIHYLYIVSSIIRNLCTEKMLKLFIFR